MNFDVLVDTLYVLYLVNGLLVRILEKAVSGFDFKKTQLTGTVSGF